MSEKILSEHSLRHIFHQKRASEQAGNSFKFINSSIVSQSSPVYSLNSKFRNEGYKQTSGSKKSPIYIPTVPPLTTQSVSFNHKHNKLSDKNCHCKAKIHWKVLSFVYNWNYVKIFPLFCNTTSLLFLSLSFFQICHNFGAKQIIHQPPQKHFSSIFKGIKWLGMVSYAFIRFQV